MWYYSKNGNQVGPVTEEELRAKAGTGEVLATDLIWKEGMPDWKPFSRVLGVQPGTGAPPVPPSLVKGSVPMHQPAAMAPMYAQKVPNYLWQSIVATLLCCMPFGIVAIVFAAKVDSLAASGDIAGAQAASKSARTWLNAAVACGLVVIVLYFILVIIAAANS